MVVVVRRWMMATESSGSEAEGEGRSSAKTVLHQGLQVSATSLDSVNRPVEASHCSPSRSHYIETALQAHLADRPDLQARTGKNKVQHRQASQISGMLNDDRLENSTLSQPCKAVQTNGDLDHGLALYGSKRSRCWCRDEETQLGYAQSMRSSKTRIEKRENGLKKVLVSATFFQAGKRVWRYSSHVATEMTVGLRHRHSRWTEDTAEGLGN